MESHTRATGQEGRPDLPAEVYEERYTQLMSAIPSSVLLLDSSLRVIAANGNFLKRTRRSEGDTISKRLAEVLPPGIAKEMDLERAVRGVWESGESVRGRRMAYRAPGVPLRIYYYSIVPVGRQGAVEEAMLLMEDVTDQIRLSQEIRQVERHLATLVESASDLIVSIDPEGRIVTWNTAAENLTGSTRDKLKDRPFSGLFTAEDSPKVTKAFSDMKEQGSPVHMELTLAARGSRKVRVSWVLSPVRGESGDVMGTVAIGRDLTEQRELEVQVMRSQKLAALGVMAGGIAHEVRNPLAVCGSAAQFLLEETPSPEFLRECAEKIHSGVRRASQTIENLLKFARPSAPEAMKAVDLVGVVQDALSLTGNEARIHKIRIGCELPGEPVPVQGNVDMLTQLFSNVILNGFKAMPRGGDLDIRFELTDNEAVVAVSDTGCGIPSEHLDKIFDPFFSTWSPGDGAGLGLSICYTIARQHGGAIAARRRERGTEFIVRLPLLAGKEAQG